MNWPICVIQLHGDLQMEKALAMDAHTPFCSFYILIVLFFLFINFNYNFIFYSFWQHVQSTN